MTINQSPLQPTPVGAFRFNTDSSKLEYYDGNQWVNVTSTSPEAQTGGTRGLMAGGANPGYSDVIDYITISSAGNATDFGDLVSGFGGYAAAVSDGHGGLQAFDPRAPELYSPTGKVLPTGTQGDTGIFGGGHNPSLTNIIDFITISSLGNGSDFGDMVGANRVGVQGQVSSNIRTIFGSIRTPSITNRLEYVEFRTKGNGSDFGDVATATGDRAGCSSSTRGIFAGGYADYLQAYLDGFEISIEAN